MYPNSETKILKLKLLVIFIFLKVLKIL